MINRKRAALVLPVIIFAVYLWQREKPAPSPSAPEVEITYDSRSSQPVAAGKKVVGLPPEVKEKRAKKIKVANLVSPEWEEKLRESLVLQGGSEIKEIKIKPVESFIWNQNGVALHVESVIVSLKNEKEEPSSFRALIDPQTGRILETWDRTVHDPVNPRESFAIKVDPRNFQN